MRVTLTVTNPNPDTIWNRLAAHLGREPTNVEAAHEVRRILRGDPVPEPQRQESKCHD